MLGPILLILLFLVAVTYGQDPPNPSSICRGASSFTGCYKLKRSMCNWCNTTSKCYYKCDIYQPHYCKGNSTNLWGRTCEKDKHEIAVAMAWLFVAVLVLTVVGFIIGLIYQYYCGRRSGYSTV